MRHVLTTVPKFCSVEVQRPAMEVSWLWNSCLLLKLTLKRLPVIETDFETVACYWNWLWNSWQLLKRTLKQLPVIETDFETVACYWNRLWNSCLLLKLTLKQSKYIYTYILEPIYIDILAQNIQNRLYKYINIYVCVRERRLRYS